MSYWTETDDFLRSHGGRGPACPNCGKTMFAADDHGRFSCFCRIGTRRRKTETLDVVSGTSLNTHDPSKEIPESEK